MKNKAKQKNQRMVSTAQFSIYVNLKYMHSKHQCLLSRTCERTYKHTGPISRQKKRMNAVNGINNKNQKTT